MSVHQAFRRQPVPGQFAQQLRTITIPAPTRGIVQHENEAFMGPGSAIVSDNWLPTMRGVKLRGGCIRHCDLHPATEALVWLNATPMGYGYCRRDAADNTLWLCQFDHVSAGTGTFADTRAAFPTMWASTPAIPIADVLRQPVISAFEYSSGNNQRMYAGQVTKLYDVSSTTPVLVKSGQTSGNYAAAQITNANGVDMLTAVNDAGDPPLRFNGTSWVVLDPSVITAWANSTAYVAGTNARDTTDQSVWTCAVNHTSPAGSTFAVARAANPTFWTAGIASDGTSWITGPAGTPVEFGKNLVYVWKYRSRLFFIQANSMNAWFLLTDSPGGVLQKIPLAGNATKGGRLLFGASWSVDAGDGIDDKCVFATDLGEVLIFTGNNPADSAQWRQEGRYALSPPLGMNAHISVGGDLIIMTVDGMVPLSLAITKDAGQLELAMLTRAIKPLWRGDVNEKRAFHWSAKKWDEYGGIFIAIPGGKVGKRYCLMANNATGAWGRCFGWDVTCFIRQRADCFFGTQDGIIMQMDRTGFDDGQPYLATLVGGWEMFRSPSQQVVWHQARAVFNATVREPFVPQLSACTDFILTLPPPPPIGLDIALADVWDEGLWGPPGSGSINPPPPADVAAYAQWDAAPPPEPVNRNTMWVSIGLTGFTHAPVVQVYVGQQATPKVELVAIAATYEVAGVNVD